MSNYSLDLNLDNFIMFDVTDLTAIMEKEEYRNQFHLYTILLAPKYYIKEESIHYDEDHVDLTFQSETTDECINISYQIDPEINHKKVLIETKLPFESFDIIFNDEEWLSAHPENKRRETLSVNQFVDLYKMHYGGTEDLKVLYIGKAYGENGTRDAFDRLSKGHETLQKILADLPRRYNGTRIKIMLLRFEKRLGVLFSPSNLSDTSSDLSDAINHPIIGKQEVSITEAALINSFKPVYNTDYVDSFPDENHGSYKQVYEKKYNEVNLEFYTLSNESTPCINLYSDEIQINKDNYFIHYDLSENDSIYSIFRNKNHSTNDNTKTE